jgi:hypothetical protein
VYDALPPGFGVRCVRDVVNKTIYLKRSNAIIHFKCLAANSYRYLKPSSQQCMVIKANSQEMTLEILVINNKD